MITNPLNIINFKEFKSDLLKKLKLIFTFPIHFISLLIYVSFILALIFYSVKISLDFSINNNFKLKQLFVLKFGQ